jgi:hypothetical protein
MSAATALRYVCSNQLAMNGLGSVLTQRAAALSSRRNISTRSSTATVVLALCAGMGNRLSQSTLSSERSPARSTHHCTVQTDAVQSYHPSHRSTCSNLRHHPTPLLTARQSFYPSLAIHKFSPETISDREVMALGPLRLTINFLGLQSLHL